MLEGGVPNDGGVAHAQVGWAGPAPQPTGSLCIAGSTPMTGPWEPDEALAAFAQLDHDRVARRGYPEAVYCEGKTPAQLAAIATVVGDRGQPTLFTRAGAAHARAVLDRLPDARHHEDARLVAWPAEPPAPSGGLVT